MPPWFLLLAIWIVGSPLLAVLVGKMIAFGGRRHAAVTPADDSAVVTSIAPASALAG